MSAWFVGIIFLSANLVRSGDAIAWIDGTPLLLQRFPDLSPPTSLKAPPPWLAPRFQIGERRTFYAIDFRQQTQYTVEASLRSIGKFCYVFVEDAQWLRRVTPAMVETIRRAFDEAVPADPGRGIYPLETATLGQPPDIDGDPRVVILLLDVRDSYVREGGYVAGYFSPVNEQRGVVRDPNLGVPFRSNEMEMIYLDVHPLDVAGRAGLSVLAHEFQHLIQWNYDTNEETWVNEGLADYAVFLCGYDISEHLTAFEQTPDTSLTVWNDAYADQLSHYGAAFLWMLYLHERYGGEATLAAIVQEPRNGIAGIRAALSSRGYTSDFAEIFADWQVANFLDDPQLADGRYGYTQVDLQPDRKRIHENYPVPPTSRSVVAWGSDAILFTNGVGGASLIVDVTEPLARFPLIVQAVEYADHRPMRVRKIALSERGHGYLAVPQFGVVTQQVLLLVAFAPLSVGDTVARYEYQARLGEQVSFQVAVIPNPVHPRYWEVVARASHRIGAEVPWITLTEGETVHLDRQPMAPIQDGLLFSRSVYVPPGRSPDRVHWRVEYLGALVGEGVLRATP